MGNQVVMGVHSCAYSEDLNHKKHKHHSESMSRRKLVKIRGVSSISEVPCDQKSPFCVRNIYSPIAYGARRIQRMLEERRKSKTMEILHECSNLFDTGQYILNHTSSSASALHIADKPVKNNHSNQLSSSLNSEDFSAVAVFVMSVHPYFSASKRPSISPKVRQALVDLFCGTDLCFLSSDTGETLVCTAVLQLSRTADVYQGSIVIYKGYDQSIIYSYIPLASVRSISRELEPGEKEYYDKSGGILSCKTPEGIFEVEIKRAFTLHYYFPNDIYATFVAFSDKDLEKWIDAINYFALVNKAFHKETN